MIRAYPRWPSVRPGRTLTLHVSTDAPHFRVELYRQGASLVRMEGVPAHRFRGYAYPDGPPDRDWGWPGYEVAVPRDWPSGAYVALLIEIDREGRERRPDGGSADGEDARALFVVRSAAPGTATRTLYKLAWATYHAYNATGYGSMYAQSVWSREDTPPGFKLTWRRPGGGTGGLVTPSDPPDAYAAAVRRNTFAKWDVPFIEWLERSGYRVDYCTDLDLHQDPEVLAPYSLLLSVGHDEYWSEAIRARKEAFVRAGGNIAFLSGNIAVYRLHFTDGDTAFTCAKVKPGAGGDPRRWEPDPWQDTARPENAITGVSSRFGGGWWAGRRETLGYTVQHAGHWVYAGTGLREGDVFGDDPGYPLIGYEVDAAAWVRRDGVAVATGEGGTPASFVILGLAELGPGWVASHPGAAATMGLYTDPSGGIVFQGATTDWPILVPRNRHVERITRNVLDRLALRGAAILGPLPAHGGRMYALRGEPARFSVDPAPFGPIDGLGFVWTVAGGTAGALDGPTLEVVADPAPGPLTVSVTVSRDGRPIGFGTLTTFPLTREELLEVQTLVAIREMVLPGTPQNALVQPAADPIERAWVLYDNRLPWIRDRARAIERVVEELIEVRRRASPPPGAGGATTG